MVTVTSLVQAIEGKEDELEKKLVAFSTKVKTEEGTVIYDLHRIRDTKGAFFFYEIFKDDVAFAHHNTTAHMQELAKQTVGLLAAEPILTHLEKISL